jgi:hypothetical protein
MKRLVGRNENYEMEVDEKRNKKKWGNQSAVFTYKVSVRKPSFGKNRSLTVDFGSEKNI